MKIIGERLRSLRESVRLSQAKLAKEFDVSQSALARYEIHALPGGFSEIRRLL